MMNEVAYPANSLPMLLSSIWIRDLMIPIVGRDNILEYSAALEDLDLLAGLVLIG